MTPSQWRAAKRFPPVLGHRMPYVESGAEIGRAIATWLRQLPAESGDG